MTGEDTALLDYYLSIGGSYATTKVGENLTQYQMLQGALITSSNNFADRLAIWAFGSLEDYRQAAQDYVNSIGLKNTTIGSDASGVKADTVSTAHDLTLLGIEAIKHPVIKEIVSQKTLNLPSDSGRPNTNFLLGNEGIIGVKTGNTPSAGGVFIIAKEITHGDEATTLVGTVQGEANGPDAINRSSELIQEFERLFTERQIVKKSQIVGKVATPWGESANLLAKEDLSFYGFNGTELKPTLKITQNPPFTKNQVVGKLHVDEKNIDIYADKPIDEPSFWWRLAHRQPAALIPIGPAPKDLLSKH